MTECLSNTIRSLKISETQGLPYELYLRVLARYLVTLNINTPDGLVNGATGILNRIDYGKRQDTSEIIPIRVWIYFDDPSVGAEHRLKFKHLIVRDKEIMSTWTPLTLEKISTWQRS